MNGSGSNGEKKCFFPRASWLGHPQTARSHEGTSSPSIWQMTQCRHAKQRGLIPTRLSFCSALAHSKGEQCTEGAEKMSYFLREVTEGFPYGGNIKWLRLTKRRISRRAICQQKFRSVTGDATKRTAGAFEPKRSELFARMLVFFVVCACMEVFPIDSWLLRVLRLARRTRRWRYSASPLSSVGSQTPLMSTYGGRAAFQVPQNADTPQDVHQMGLKL